jgi:hypothetical protein
MAQHRAGNDGKIANVSCESPQEATGRLTLSGVNGASCVLKCIDGRGTHWRTQFVAQMPSDYQPLILTINRRP